MTQKLLEVKNVTKIFRIGGLIRGKRLVAVDDVSLEIEREKPVILSIVGESGCGKSTLCRMLLRIHKPDMGDIVLSGSSYADRKNYDPTRFRLDVQPIFQNPYEAFSARKKVDTYLYNTALRLGIAKNRKEADERIDEVLKSVGMSLSVVKGKYPTQFSGGELQRISIARALITRPKLIIADEPVSAVDASLKMNIVNLFKELKDEYNVSFIYVTTIFPQPTMYQTIWPHYRGSLIEYGPARRLWTILPIPIRAFSKRSAQSWEKWDEELVMPDMEEKEYAITYCKFAPAAPTPRTSAGSRDRR